MKRIITAICIVCFLCLLPATSNSTLWKYDIIGSGIYVPDLSVPGESRQITVTGYAFINDIPVAGTIGQPQVTFDIERFSLSIQTLAETLIFTGYGNIYMGYLDDYLHLYGSGDWTAWHFDEEKRPAYHLSDIMYYGQDLQWFSPNNIRAAITFTRDPNPVPIPPSSLLLGFPFICIMLMRQRHHLLIYKHARRILAKMIF